MSEPRVTYGVLLDDDWSIDEYPTREEADRALHMFGGDALVRITVDRLDGLDEPSAISEFVADILARIEELEAAQEPHNRPLSDSGGLHDQLHTRDDGEGA